MCGIFGYVAPSQDYSKDAAKIIVEGEIQWITYHEFLPILLGNSAIGDYPGYDPSVDPQIRNEFSTAAYRFGHDAISSTVERLNPDGSDFGASDLIHINVSHTAEEALRALI